MGSTTGKAFHLVLKQLCAVKRTLAAVNQLLRGISKHLTEAVGRNIPTVCFPPISLWETSQSVPQHEEKLLHALGSLPLTHRRLSSKGKMWS